jgi:hypothetical protein
LLQPYCTFNALSFYSLRVQFKCTHGLHTKFETFPFLLISSGVSCLSTQNMFMKPFFHELTMRYSIFKMIYLSRVIPSFHQQSWNEDPIERIQLIVLQHINLFKKEDHRELLKIVEDRCNPFPLFLPRNLGSRFL